MIVIVGSLSARKLNVVASVFERFYPQAHLEVRGCSALSQMPDMPFDRQTLTGARNRAAALSTDTSANYCVGLESGLVERYGLIFEEAWCSILDSSKKECVGYSSGLMVPEVILSLMHQTQLDHSDVMTQVEKQRGDLPNDSWSTYTGGVLQRTISLEEATRNALVQFAPLENSMY